MALLRRDPRARADLRRIREYLDEAEVQEVGVPLAPDSPPGSLLIGREREWGCLNSALRRSQAGRTVVVQAHGPSGIGKSTLIRHFIEHLESRGATILPGRCYEHESVPYKALDSLVDALGHHLERLSNEQTAVLLPPHIRLLARVFPVLGRIALIDAAIPDPDEEQMNPREQRRRAFRALRELLRNMARETLLVLFLDDVQWGDRDNAELLGEILKPPASPPLLLITCYRDEARAHSLFVQLLRQQVERTTSVDEIDLPVGPLTDEATLELIEALLEQAGVQHPARSMVREARGNPFFIQTLVDFATRGSGAAAPASLTNLTLEDALSGRLDALSDTARELLELVSLAGRPISESILGKACTMGQEQIPTLRSLRTTHLIRSCTAERRGQVEPYHDRIRVAVLDRIKPARQRALHQTLAEALTSLEQVDPEVLAFHYEEAGDLIRSSEFARAAADLAAKALAFARAARLYEQALRGVRDDPAKVRKLQVKLADALVNARRGAEAAPIYLAAAEGAPKGEALELQRHAAEEWLKSGYFDRGFGILRRVLAAQQMSMARTPRRALLSMLWRRARLFVRGQGYQLRSLNDIPAEKLARIDLCWSAWSGLGMHDFIRAGDFHALNMLLSLEAGEPYRIARALAMEACMLTALGPRNHGRATDLLAHARELLGTSGSRHGRGLLEVATGICAYMEGRFGDILEPCSAAQALLRGCPGTSWELSIANLYALEGLVHMGQLKEVKLRLAEYYQDADSRGDLFGTLSLQLLNHLPILADDAPEAARRSVEEAMSRYTNQGIHIPHFWEFYALGQILLYAEPGAAALEYVTMRWPTLKRSLFLRLPVVRISSYYLRGRCTLRAAEQAGGQAERDDEARPASGPAPWSGKP